MSFATAAGEDIVNVASPFVRMMLDQRQSIKFEYYQARKDCNGFRFDEHLVSHVGADGELSLCCVLMSNITSHREAIRDAREAAERMADAARIRFLAMHDSLTGMANRTQLNELLVTFADRLKADCGDKGMLASAQGVETEAQRTILRRMRLHATQGFLIARPMSAADFMVWLQTAVFKN